MSFSIKQIKAILSSHNLPVDELDKTAEELCSRHVADMDSIKEERDNLRKDAETLVEVQKELETLKAANGDSFKVKYEALKEEFQNYKNDIEAKETKAKIQGLYKTLLKEAGVSEKRIDSVLKVTDTSTLKLDKDGNLEGAKDLSENIKKEWSDFIETRGEHGANPATPPDSNPGKPGSTGRAKQIASSYFANLYGTQKKGES